MNKNSDFSSEKPLKKDLNSEELSEENDEEKLDEADDEIEKLNHEESQIAFPLAEPVKIESVNTNFAFRENKFNDNNDDDEWDTNRITYAQTADYGECVEEPSSYSTPKPQYNSKSNSSCVVAHAVLPENNINIAILLLFRDKVLAHYSWGQKFIDLYYSKLGPNLVRFIGKNRYKKNIARKMIYLFVGFTKLFIRKS